jgi:hypothetical protein
MINDKELKYQIARPLSEDDIRLAIKKLKTKIKIISYPELERYKSINELFGKYKYISLLYTSDESKVGHWVLLIKHSPQEIELFDSYAYKPDNLLKFFKKNNKIEMFPLLTSLLNESGIKKLHYSKKRIQRLRNDVGVCGRWIIIRVIYDLLGLTLADMIKDVKNNKFFKKGFYDGFAVLMTMDLV